MSLEKFVTRASSFVANELIAKGWTTHPGKEIINSFGRTPSEGFYKATSLGGRLVCLVMVPTHLLGIVLKPSLYGAFAAAKTCLLPFSVIGTAALGVMNLFHGRNDRLSREYRPFNISVCIIKSAACAAVSIPGQIAQAGKAAAGVIYPRAYFYQDKSLGSDYHYNHYRHNPYENAFNTDLRLDIDREQLEKNPEDVLKYLSAQIKKMKTEEALNVTVTYKGEEGSDCGGLKRDFFDSLFRHLSEKLGLDKEDILAFNDETKKIISDLGIVLEMLLRGIDEVGSRSETPIPEGCVHHAYFVNILKFSYEDLQADFNRLSPQRMYQLLSELHDGKDLGYYYEYCSQLLDWDGSANKNTSQFQIIFDTINSVEGKDYAFSAEGSMNNKSLKALKEDVHATALQTATDLKTIHALARGICRDDRIRWRELKNWNADRLENHLMGDSWDSKIFLERVVVGNDEKGKAIEKWLESLSIPEQKAFVRFVTGSGTMPNVNEEIYFQYIFSGKKPIAHTCSRTIEISWQNDIEDSIEHMNDYFVKAKNTQFGIA